MTKMSDTSARWFAVFLGLQYGVALIKFGELVLYLTGIVLMLIILYIIFNRN